MDRSVKSRDHPGRSDRLRGTFKVTKGPLLRLFAVLLTNVDHADELVPIEGPRSSRHRSPRGGRAGSQRERQDGDDPQPRHQRPSRGPHRVSRTLALDVALVRCRDAAPVRAVMAARSSSGKSGEAGDDGDHW